MEYCISAHTKPTNLPQILTCEGFKSLVSQPGSIGKVCTVCMYIVVWNAGLNYRTIIREVKKSSAQKSVLR